MSKRRGQARNFEHRVTRRRAKKVISVSWTWKDQLVLGGFVFGAICLVVSFCLFLSYQSYRRTIEGRVERWRGKYDLSRAQVEKLTALEMKFHRHDQLLSIRSRPTKEEEKAHRQELAKLLGIENPNQIREHSIR